jgi:serine/threonine protein kinase
MNAKLKREADVEIGIFQKVHNKHIIQCISSDIDKNGNPCAIFEFANGGSLADYMNKNPNLDVTTRLEIIDNVLLGISYLHNVQKFMHRRIDSTNIFIFLD